MAKRNPHELSGRSPNGVRRMDHLETGVRAVPQWVFGVGGAGVHDPIGTRGHTLHPIRAWLILSIIALSIGAVAATFYIQWKWG